jgi:UDP-N-acetylglucosamine:LPS N-acetylglucosamine transferase
LKALVLTASMGGGHVQVSKELARRLSELGWETTVVDMLGSTPRWGSFLHRLYPWLVNDAPWLYDVIYRRFFLAGERSVRRSWLPVRLAERGLRRCLDEQRPDVVVSTYHLAAVCVARLRSRRDLGVPAVTFVTTFGVHDLWLHPGTDLYLCITPHAADSVTARTSAPVQVCEPVVRPMFAREAPPAPRSDGRRALVTAGALGMGDVVEVTKALAALRGWSPVVVCGANERLRGRLSDLPHAEVHGWVERMDELMASVDVVIDNAGGSTAKEALALGRPVVTYRPIAGHGRHDALMMQRAGLTEVVDDVSRLAGALHRLEDDTHRGDRVARGQSLFGQDPARLIADVVRSPGAVIPFSSHSAT